MREDTWCSEMKYKKEEKGSAKEKHGKYQKNKNKEPAKRPAPKTFQEAVDDPYFH